MSCANSWHFYCCIAQSGFVLSALMQDFWLMKTRSHAPFEGSNERHRIEVERWDACNFG